MKSTGSEFCKKNMDVAMRIADMYHSRFPRTKYYPVELYESECCDNRETYYYPLNEEELQVLKNWEDLSEEDKEWYGDLHAYLEDNKPELKSRFLNVSSRYHLDTVENCDTSNYNYFTEFKIAELSKEYGCYTRELRIMLSDNDYLTLLAMHLVNSNFNFNQLVRVNPLLAQKLTEKFNHVMTDGVDYVYNKPFLVIMTEFREKAKSIMDSGIDSAGAFSSENEDIRRFCRKHAWDDIEE